MLKSGLFSWEAVYSLFFCVNAGPDADLRVPSGCDHLSPLLTLPYHTPDYLLTRSVLFPNRIPEKKSLLRPPGRPAPPPPPWKTSILYHFFWSQKRAFFWLYLALKWYIFCPFFNMSFNCIFGHIFISFLIVSGPVRAKNASVFMWGALFAIFCVYLLCCVSILCASLLGGTPICAFLRGVTTLS